MEHSHRNFVRPGHPRPAMPRSDNTFDFGHGITAGKYWLSLTKNHVPKYLFILRPGIFPDRCLKLLIAADDFAAGIGQCCRASVLSSEPSLSICRKRFMVPGPKNGFSPASINLTAGPTPRLLPDSSMRLLSPFLFQSLGRCQSTSLRLGSYKLMPLPAVFQ